MKGIAIERWPFSAVVNIQKLMEEKFGPSSKDTWYIDQDYDLETLIMNDEIYVFYKLSGYDV